MREIERIKNPSRAQREERGEEQKSHPRAPQNQGQEHKREARNGLEEETPEGFRFGGQRTALAAPAGLIPEHSFLPVEVVAEVAVLSGAGSLRIAAPAHVRRRPVNSLDRKST